MGESIRGLEGNIGHFQSAHVDKCVVSTLSPYVTPHVSHPYVNSHVRHLMSKSSWTMDKVHKKALHI